MSKQNPTNKAANDSAPKKQPRKKVVYVKGLSVERMAKMAQMDPYYRNLKFQMPGNNNLESFGLIPGVANINICFNGEPCKMDIPDILVNCMADPDTLEERLKYLEALLPKLISENPKLMIVNHPSGILKTRRSDISDMFQGLKGIIVPKTIKIFPKTRREFVEKVQESKLRLPLILREAGQHGGSNLVLLENFSDEQIEQIDRFALDGRGYYATEFVSCKGKDGYYRKARIIMIDGEPVLRHMIVSTDWNIHARSREDVMKKNTHLIEEEKNFLKKGKANFSKEILNSLKKIYEKLELDVYGMDVGLMPNGDLLVFEINAAMEFIAQKLKHDSYIFEQIDFVKENFMKFLTTPQA